jgi:hypothetical protein
MTVMSYCYGGTKTPDGYHYGLGGLGVRGDEIPDFGVAGPALQYEDITLPGEAADEFRVVLLTTPTLGTLFVYEDSSFEYSGPDGVHTFTYAGYKNGVLYGTATVTLTIGFGLGGNLVLDSFLVEGTFEGVDFIPDTLGRRIAPRVALRANGELLVLF